MSYFGWSVFLFATVFMLSMVSIIRNATNNHGTDDDDDNYR